MIRAVIGYTNGVILGTVAASSFVTGLGPDQLQNDQGGMSFALRIPATSGTITVTWTGTYHGLGLFRTNLTTSAVVTWTVKNGASTVFTGNSLPVVAGFGQTALVLGTPVSGTSVQISISDGTNPDGFLSVALAYVGPLFQPALNLDFQSAPGRMDQTTIATTRSGAEVVRNDFIRRTYDMSFSALKDVEQTAIFAIDLAGRQGNNLFFVPDPASLIINAQAIFGRLIPKSNLTYALQAADARGYQAQMSERL